MGEGGGGSGQSGVMEVASGGSCFCKVEGHFAAALHLHPIRFPR